MREWSAQATGLLSVKKGQIAMMWKSDEEPVKTPEQNVELASEQILLERIFDKKDASMHADASGTINRFSIRSKNKVIAISPRSDRIHNVVCPRAEEGIRRRAAGCYRQSKTTKSYQHNATCCDVLHTTQVTGDDSALVKLKKHAINVEVVPPFNHRTNKPRVYVWDQLLK
jgi:hypothetical protein